LPTVSASGVATSVVAGSVAARSGATAGICEAAVSLARAGTMARSGQDAPSATQACSRAGRGVDMELRDR
jgi:hypothetical protein